MTPNERLKQIRLEMNLSQVSFGKLLGLLQGSYSDIERGKVNPSSAVLSRLELLGFNSEYVTKGIGSMRRNPSISARERILTLIEDLGFGSDLKGFSEQLNIDVLDLSFVNSKDAIISDAVINAILNNFKQVNREWLVAGKGAMYNRDSQQLEILHKEVQKLKETIYEKNELLKEKDKMIATLYKQIDLLQSFIPERGT